MKSKQEEQKEMVGGCCVCSDENGWAENPLVYCDGQGCNVAVHQACYGIVTVPTGSWFCRKCESQERSARVRCELCPSKDGALKRTDSGGWAHVVCALYIPEVRFGNVTTMEPIMLQLVPPERFNKICYICDAGQKGSATSNRAQMGACMQCNRQGCKNNFHVTCAQSMGLLCEEAGNYLDNVKYCGYCSYHFEKLQNTFQKKGSTVKTIPPYRPVNRDSDYSDEESSSKVAVIGENKEKQSGSGTEGNSDDLKEKHKKRSKILSGLDSKIRDIKPNISDLSSSSKDTTSLSDSTTSENNKEQNTSVLDKSSSNVVMPITVKSEPKNNNSGEPSHSSLVPNFKLSGSSVTKYSTSSGSISSSETVSTTSSTPSASSSTFLADPVIRPSVLDAGGVTSSDSVTSSLSLTSITASSHSSTTISLSSESSHGKGIVTTLSSSSNSRTKNSLPLSSFSQDKNREKDKDSFPTTSETSTIDKEKDKQRKIRRNASKSSITTKDSDDISMSTEEDSPTKESTLNIREEKNLGVENRDRGKFRNSSEDSKLNVQFTPNVSATSSRMDTFAEFSGIVEPSKRSRSNSQDKNRRSKRGGNGGGSNNSATTKRSRTFREMKESPPSSPESFTTTETPPKKSRLNKKSESKESIISNGLSSNALLLGNQINPASSMARKMADTLHAELEAHSIYKEDDKISTGLIGPILPGKRENSSSGNVLNSSQPPPLPQSLEQLLERQWEQGSQFLMEQAQHFDIASLLSCLHQLRQENVRLEETVNSLVARRDHLLAVNARLSVPLNTTPSSTSGTSLATTTSTVTIASTLSANQPPPSTSLVSITPTGPPAVSASVVLGGHPSSQLAQHPGGNPRPHSAGRHPSGGSAAHITMTSTQGGRGGSPHDRRGGPQQVTPLENGLGESDYRYHRQQSPMLPPAAQPSQTSLRHSPASINYQSGSSPHSVVPSLSPSNISHPISSHTLVAHSAPHGGGHAPIMVSSSHGPPHSVSLARGSDHSRAELVRLSSQAPPPHGVATYPIYQMVSPPVHHSPVAISQHPPPSHTQVMRRETVDSGRANHSSLEKR